ncbi:response regulator [Shewanella woodyi]|uniref:response regulator n=1 Tax=Shewanella woodyi TaxID=60961 RepID=UPI003749179B
MAFSGSALGKVNVVICDDSITNVLVMNEMLKTIDMNLSITSITDPRKVMAELEFDVMLVILDLEMPYLSGYQILEQIRARYNSEELPVIVVSGLSDQKSHIKALKGEQMILFVNLLTNMSLNFV